MTKHPTTQLNTYITLYLIIPSICVILSLLLYYSYKIYNIFLLINTIERINNSKLIYIKDINTRIIDNLLMLFFKNTIVSINDNNKLRYILQNNSNKKIMFIIKSTGGYISSSDSMLNLLDCHKPTKNIYVPSYAMSAATLFVLACNNIYMNKYAAIGPTDPQISVYDDMVSFSSIRKLIQAKSIENIKDKILIKYYDNLILYDDNVKLIIKYINKHKKKNANPYDIDELIKIFSYGDIAHHTEINSAILSKVFNINYNIPEDIMEIYNQFNYIFQIM